jgi:hypothetical protein
MTEPSQRKPLPLRQIGGKPLWDWIQLFGVIAIPVVLTVWV